MMNPIRIEILQKLQQVSEMAPDLRFGQLIANMAFLAAGPWNETLWDLEDDQLLGALKQHVNDLENRETTAGGVK